MKVYHLHLPRTSGVFLRTQLNLSSCISGHQDRINIDDFKTVDYAMGHYGIYPIQYAKQSFAILRNPLDRTISYFKYIKEKLYHNLDMIDVIDLYLNDFNLYNSVSNMSNNFLTGNLNFNLYNENIKDIKKVVENGWYLEKVSTSYKKSIDIIKESGLHIFYYEDKFLYDKISDVYQRKIDKDAPIYKNSSKDYYIPKYLIKNFEELNSIDMEIYEHFKK